MFSMGQVTVAGGTTGTLCQVPAGPCVVCIQSDSGSPSEAYIGIQATGGSVTSSNGYPMPVGGNLTFARYQSQPNATLLAVSSGTATLGWLISGP